MADQQFETLKVVAVKRALSIFGRDATNLLRYYFYKYNISLDSDADSCSLEQLHLALSKLIGERSTALLLESVYIEIDRLAEAPKC